MILTASRSPFSSSAAHSSAGHSSAGFRHAGSGGTGTVRRLARRLVGGLALLPLFGMLAGCNLVVMQPAGDVAVQQRNLIIASTGLMLLIILPVIALTLLFAWRYRASNKDAVHDPDWNHSTQLEVVIWTAPLLIIIALGALTWISTHTLDPFRALSRIQPGRPVAADVKPIEVQVVALDWKWLFFYPELGIASVNELAAPVDRPIHFKLTSTSVMNAFYIPALAGMIYTMPGMQTQLHAVVNKEGVFNGLASQYSGTGFSRMTFKFHGMQPDAFEKWVAKVKEQGSDLSREAYQDLEKPSEAVAPRFYKTVADGLYDSILNMCAEPGRMCMGEMMHIDMHGSEEERKNPENFERLRYDNRRIEKGEEPAAATVPATNRAPRSEDVVPGHEPKPPGPAQHHH